MNFTHEAEKLIDQLSHTNWTKEDIALGLELMANRAINEWIEGRFNPIDEKGSHEDREHTDRQ